MCGRYTLLADELEVRKAFDVNKPITHFEKSYNIAPGQQVLAIIHDGTEKRAGYLKWGLVPAWAEDEKIGYKMINARSETAHQKQSFKKLMATKRCLIAADSFYEWQREGETKQPKRIQLENRNLFAFAGLWDKWTDGDKEIFTCTILTKEANAFMSPIHHRMPVILPKDKEDEWIAPVKCSPETSYNFLQSLEDGPLSVYNVDSYVNAAKHNDHRCIEPIDG